MVLLNFDLTLSKLYLDLKLQLAEYLLNHYPFALDKLINIDKNLW